MAVGLQNFRLKTLYNLPTYTDNIPNIAMKKRLLLLAILPLSLHAADVPPDVKPELQVNTAEPQQPVTHNTPAEQTNRPSEKNVAAFFIRPLPPASGMAMEAKQKGGTRAARGVNNRL